MASASPRVETSIVFNRSAWPSVYGMFDQLSDPVPYLEQGRTDVSDLSSWQAGWRLARALFSTWIQDPKEGISDIDL